MQFAFTEEQALIQRHRARILRGAWRAVRDCAQRSSRRRATTRRLWRAIGEEMGWCGIALPAEVGGSGLGGVELAILC